MGDVYERVESHAGKSTLTGKEIAVFSTLLGGLAEALKTLMNY